MFLTGKALEAYSSFGTEDSSNYAKIKSAVLKVYECQRHIVSGLVDHGENRQPDVC